ncbi:melanoma-associated antigen B16-like [Diachasmimorpha longicaudata]|uniref:melanoma-associated antigen B16-like n=1 Tax=Diachasmimorpha longicaudata TaxID=58733 RepID=UPI0030B91513
MSRKSQRLKQNSRMELDSDEEAGPSNAPPRGRKGSQRSTQSQRSQRYSDDNDEVSLTQSRRRGADLPEDEENHVLGTLLKFLLSAAVDKNAIKQADIKAYGIPSHVKHYRNLMAKAKAVLHEIFGYKLIDIGGGKWIIVNALPHDQIRLEVDDVPAQTLLYLVLSHIFMSGERCREDNLIQYLMCLDIWRDGAVHPYFGNIQEMLQKRFVQQVYLVRNKVSEGDSEAYEYVWGQRATEECDPRNIVEFLAKVFNRPPESWKQQYRKAHGLETPVP